MDANPVELFLHIVGVIAMFVGYGTVVLGTIALRRATRVEDVKAIANALTYGRRVGLEHISVIDVVAVAGVLVIAVTGLDMARYTGDWRMGWVQVAVATFVLLAPVGPFVINPRLHAITRAASLETSGDVPLGLHGLLTDRVLTIAVRTSLAVLVGLVFLMAVKPSLLGSIAAILVAVVAGTISGALGKK